MESIRMIWKWNINSLTEQMAVPTTIEDEEENTMAVGMVMGDENTMTVGTTMEDENPMAVGTVMEDENTMAVGTTMEDENPMAVGTVMEEENTMAVGRTVIDEHSLGKEWTSLGPKGSFGEFFKTRHHQWDKDVAVKIIGLHDGRPEEELICEADLMLRAEGPYVQKILGIFLGARPQSPFIYIGLVTDMMKRGSLFSMQKKRENKLLPWPLVFRLAHQVAVGMKDLHSLTPALIHKDLKPNNVLLDSDLNVKITDFNQAMFTSRETVYALRGVQTPFFRPPEHSWHKATGAHSYDVYSYAILVWTILNPGHSYAPFDVSNGERPSLEDVENMKAEVPGLEELVELMVNCWSQDCDQRPTFAECAAVTKELYEKQKHGITDAVRKVLEELDAAPEDEPAEVLINPPHPPPLDVHVV